MAQMWYAPALHTTWHYLIHTQWKMATTVTASLGSGTPNAKKVGSKKALDGWEEELQDGFEFEFDGDKAIKAFCMS